MLHNLGKASLTVGLLIRKVGHAQVRIHSTEGTPAEREIVRSYGAKARAIHRQPPCQRPVVPVTEDLRKQSSVMSLYYSVGLF